VVVSAEPSWPANAVHCALDGISSRATNGICLEVQTRAPHRADGDDAAAELHLGPFGGEWLHLEGLIDRAPVWARPQPDTRFGQPTRRLALEDHALQGAFHATIGHRLYLAPLRELLALPVSSPMGLDYGALKGGPHRWLDLDRYYGLLRTDDDVQRIWYFTAVIQGPRRRHQLTYLRALSSTPRVSIQHGRYKEKLVRCTVAGCRYTGSRAFHVPEEKRTDVNIAVQMLDDANQHQAERMVLVSGDPDLVPAIRTIKQRFPTIQAIVYVPARDPRRGAATELRTAADRHKTLPLGLLMRAQFATVVSTPNGSVVRPAAWT
jgi:6-hydroxy-3-succinoylpyridine 3-monooxygenase